ncbi:hypothetical protein PF005_g8026 [Phytophthora fragariae]|nr:hypothetical protein PF003_g22582 [Phytophthora fragariae]KAE9021844.1 hypothetical protein PR002_g12135 [Phytophthora rubi]KAE8941550.1 hypothetical protein PF009_g8662 [Phytophthora fragariae]KAE9015391.1 hypothetical protein PF011_g7636 [Phytophthora fragariae]KAE9120299.1 hypothetical protein PF010_g7540 [Phytophthora fragariae]
MFAFLTGTAINAQAKPTAKQEEPLRALTFKREMASENLAMAIPMAHISGGIDSSASIDMSKLFASSEQGQANNE